jgi:hypothetical protein
VILFSYILTPRSEQTDEGKMAQQDYKTEGSITKLLMLDSYIAFSNTRPTTQHIAKYSEAYFQMGAF